MDTEINLPPDNTERTHMLPLRELTRSRHTAVSVYLPVMSSENNRLWHTIHEAWGRKKIRLFSRGQAWRIPYMNCLTEMERSERTIDVEIWEKIPHAQNLHSKEYSQSVLFISASTVHFYLIYLFKLRLNRGSLKHHNVHLPLSLLVRERRDGMLRAVAMFLLL